MWNRALVALRAAGVALALTLTGAGTATFAQDTTVVADTAAQVDDVDVVDVVDDEDEGFDDWGLLGLAGLARRPARAVVVDPAPTATRRVDTVDRTDTLR